MKFAKKPILNFFFLKTGNEKELSFYLLFLYNLMITKYLEVYFYKSIPANK